MQKKTLKTVMHPVFGLLTAPPKALDLSRGVAEQLKEDIMQGEHNLARDAASSHELLSIVLEVHELYQWSKDPRKLFMDPVDVRKEVERRWEALVERTVPWWEGARADE